MSFLVTILGSSLAISFSQNVNFPPIFSVAQSAFFLNKSDSSSRIPASIFHLWSMIAGCKEFKPIGKGEIFCMNNGLF